MRFLKTQKTRLKQLLVAAYGGRLLLRTGSMASPSHQTTDEAGDGEVEVLQNLDYTRPVREQMARLSAVRGESSKLHLDVADEADDVLGKSTLDLYLPQGRGQGAAPPPVAVFVHGGGWRRGHKQAWQHYLSRYDTNLPVYMVHRYFGVYDNIGEGLARRGVACAVVTYPLCTLPLPWYLMEMCVSFMCTTGTLTALLLPALFTLGTVLRGTRTPLGGALLAAAGLSQLITWGIMVLRRKYYGLDWRAVANQAMCVGVATLLQVALLRLGGARHVGVLGVFGAACLASAAVVQGTVLWLYLRLPSPSYHHQIQAVTDSVRWVQDWGRATGAFDQSQLFLVGHSAGGHLVTMATVNHLKQKHTIQGLQGVISISGVYNIPGLAQGASGLLRHIYVRAPFGADRGLWRECSPHHCLEAWATEPAHRRAQAPPVLLVNASWDFRLEQQAVNLSRLLRDAGVPVTKWTLDSTNHFTITACFGGTALEAECVRFIVRNCSQAKS